MTKKPIDWPGTDEEWAEYQEMLSEDAPKPEDKIVQAIASLVTAIQSRPIVPKDDSVADEISALTRMIALKMVPPPVAQVTRKWKFSVVYDGDKITEVEAEKA